MPGPAPRRVTVFVTCLVDLLYPEVGRATVALLERLGLEVDFPAAQTCCGQPAFNAGYRDEARTVAEGLLDAMAGSEVVVTPSGSCAGMIRAFYSGLFDGTRDRARAENLAGRTFELTEFLVDRMGVESLGGAWEGSVTWHDACHGLREVGLSDQARKLLGGIEGLELVEMARPDICCGFGGMFSVKLPEVASAMADDKLDQAARTGASALVTGDAGCLMHLSGRMSRLGSPMRAVHVATLLAEALDLVPRPAGAPR